MIKIENDGTSMTAYIYGEIDHHTARIIRESIDSRAELTLPKTLVLNFLDVSFMDSSGIGLVMGRYKLMASLGGEIKIINTSSSIRRMMKLAGLERIANIEDITE